MKFGMRTPNLKKSIIARTTGKFHYSQMIKKEVDRCRKKRYNNRVSEVRNVIHLKIGGSHMKKRIGKNKWLKGLFFLQLFLSDPYYGSQCSRCCEDIRFL